MQIKEQPNEYDVVIIGSGAGGGMATKILTEGGAKVALLEAGPYFDSEEGDMFKWPYDSPRRGASTKEKPFGEFDANYGGWDIDGEPYTNADGSNFKWFRARMLGGRTNHWGRISLRFGPHDFKRKSLDGLGDDWPISYEDVAPYYDRVDRYVGIFGSKEGLYNEPDGIFMPPPRPRGYELLIQKASRSIGVHPSVFLQFLHGCLSLHVPLNTTKAHTDHLAITAANAAGAAPHTPTFQVPPSSFLRPKLPATWK